MDIRITNMSLNRTTYLIVSHPSYFNLIIVLIFPPRQKSISQSIRFFRLETRFLNGHIFANIGTYEINTTVTLTFKLFSTTHWEMFIYSKSLKTRSKTKVTWQIMLDRGSRLKKNDI